MTLVLTIELTLNEDGEADIKNDSRDLEAFASEIADSALAALSEFVEDAKCTLALK